MKNKKLYSLNREIAKTVNLGQVNPTLKAILRGLWKLSTNDEFIGMTGDNILAYCVEHKLWSTKQERAKYITTWAYYVKTLKTLGVIESGTTSEGAIEEYLEEEEVE